MNYNKHWYNSNEMQKQQIETALFASVAGKHDTPLDEHFSGRHVHPTTIKHLNEHMDDFYDKAQQHLQPHEDDNLLGHNFLLARNGHGAGYFDKYYQNGDKLYKLAKKYPEVHLYPGIDGMVHHHGSSENVPEDHKFGREEDEDDDFRGGDGDIEPKGDGPKGGHALKAPEYSLAYCKSIKYSAKPELDSIIRKIHSDPYNNSHHLNLANHISQHHPEAEPIANLINQYNGAALPMEHHKGNDGGHTGNLWHEPCETVSFSHNNRYLGDIGPFSLNISHAPDSKIRPNSASGKNQRFVVHAHIKEKNKPEDKAKAVEYNFEFPSHNTEDLDKFIGKLDSAHPDNRDTVDALLKRVEDIKFGKDDDEDKDENDDDNDDPKPKNDGPKGGHALKVPEYQLAYSRAIQYSFKRSYADFNTLVRNIHADPHNNLHHGILADYISEHHPEAEPIAHLIRQYSEHVPPMEHLKQVENEKGIKNEPI